ncbi:hypothetical protein ACFLY7_01635 [Patescibacteria group bacterium]
MKLLFTWSPFLISALIFLGFVTYQKIHFGEWIKDSYQESYFIAVIVVLFLLSLIFSAIGNCTC